MAIRHSTPADNSFTPLGKIAWDAGHDGDASDLAFVPSGTGATSRTVQAKLRELEISIKDYGAACDDSTDDTAAFQAAVDALVASDNNLRSGAKIVIPGPTVISGTITFTKLSYILEGRGWGYTSDSSNTRRSYVRWNGAAGSPMFKFVDCFGGMVVRDLNLKGKTTAKPSAAIEWNEGAATGVPNANCSLENVRIGSFSGETDAGTQFTDGIVWTGTNNNSEHRMVGVFITGCSGYGIKQVSIQNVNIKADHLTVASCGTGAYVTGTLEGSNWNFSSNTVDFETPVLDGGGSATDPLITCHNYYSELAGRMASFVGTARFIIHEGQFQLSASLNVDGNVAVQTGNLALLFELHNFKFTAGSPPTAPKFSFRSSLGGAGQRVVVFDGVSGWSNMTGGTNGLDIATRGPTDRTYVYFREYSGTASSTPASVAQNFLNGLNVDWDSNRFHVRNDTGLKMMDDFTGITLDDKKWLGRVGSDGSCVTPAIVSGVHGGVMRMTTGASATADNATNGVLMRSEAHWIANQGGLAFECRVKPPASITSQAAFFGFTSGLGTGALANADFPFTLVAGALTSNAVDACGFLYDTSATAGTVWHLVGVANNVDATMQHLAVGPSASTNVTLRVELSDTGVATFYVNGAKVGTTLTGAVTASVALTPVVAAFRRGAATSIYNFDYVAVECNRSL